MCMYILYVCAYVIHMYYSLEKTLAFPVSVLFYFHIPR